MKQCTGDLYQLSGRSTGLSHRQFFIDDWEMSDQTFIDIYHVQLKFTRTSPVPFCRRFESSSLKIPLKISETFAWYLVLVQVHALLKVFLKVLFPKSSFNFRVKYNIYYK